MNKVIIQIGLLIFFISLVVFSKMDLPLQDVLIRSFSAAIIISILISIVAVLFIKSLKNISSKKEIEPSQRIESKKG